MSRRTGQSRIVVLNNASVGLTIRPLWSHIDGGIVRREHASNFEARTKLKIRDFALPFLHFRISIPRPASNHLNRSGVERIRIGKTTSDASSATGGKQASSFGRGESGAASTRKGIAIEFERGDGVDCECFARIDPGWKSFCSGTYGAR